MIQFLNFILGISYLLHTANGHGHLVTPRSRNWLASQTQEGTWTPIAGRPPAESCPHCLNLKLSERLCGIGGAQDYDEWNDSMGVPMAWNSQATLKVGEVFDVTAVLTANHAGHMELKLCKYNDPNMNLDQDCLDAHPLEFVEDLSYGIPKDVNHPERAYFADVGATTYHFKFKVPESYTDVIGEKVIMQWRYVTANSCQPEGYKNSDISTYLLSKGWLRAGGTLRDCVEPYYQDGSRSETSPEQFWNCAEVTVIAGGPTAPVSQPVAQPVAQPVSQPVAQPVSQPVAPPVSQPVAQPVSQPVAPPAPAPTSTSGFCNYGPDGTGATSTCEGGAEGGPWCNESSSNCLNCNGRWCTVGTNDYTPSPTHHPSLRATASPTKAPVATPPTTQENTFCCSYDHFNCAGGEWCNQSESNCLACSGAWISSAPPTDCRLPKWAACTNDPTGCCGSTCNGAPGDWYRQCV